MVEVMHREMNTDRVAYEQTLTGRRTTKHLLKCYRYSKSSRPPTVMTLASETAETESNQSNLCAEFFSTVHVKSCNVEKPEKLSEPYHHRIGSETEISEDMRKIICSPPDITKAKVLMKSRRSFTGKRSKIFRLTESKFLPIMAIWERPKIMEALLDVLCFPEEF